MGTLTISMAIFHSYVSHYQAGYTQSSSFVSSGPPHSRGVYVHGINWSSELASFNAGRLPQVGGSGAQHHLKNNTLTYYYKYMCITDWANRELFYNCCTDGRSTFEVYTDFKEDPRWTGLTFRKKNVVRFWRSKVPCHQLLWCNLL